MGATLNIANESAAYTITDRGTYLAQQERLALAILVEGDPALLNIYHVIDSPRSRRTRQRGGRPGASPTGSWRRRRRSSIGVFGIEQFGEPLFVPDAGKTDNADRSRRLMGDLLATRCAKRFGCC